jgi:hypothetical protein
MFTVLLKHVETTYACFYDVPIPLYGLGGTVFFFIMSVKTIKKIYLKNRNIFSKSKIGKPGPLSKYAGF